jgi:tight adherence protein B
VLLFTWTMWDAAVEERRILWRRYKAYVGKRLRAIYSPLGIKGFALRQGLLVVGGLALGTWLIALPFGLLFAVFLAYAPISWLDRRRAQRKKALEAQLDATLQSLANTILVTQTLEDGFATIAQHFDPPIGQEADILVKQVRLGTPMDEALRAFADRCQSRNVDAIVTALTIGRQTGGELPKVLETTAAVLRETMRVEGMMESKTAEGNAQMLVMTLVPFLFGAAVYALAPDWIAPLWSDPIGWGLLAVAAVLWAIGLALGRKLRAIEV